MALRVLLADESTTIKKVMQLALQDFAVEVKAVHVGIDVLEVARSFQPDLIFADVLLQKKNGYDVCGELKRDPLLKSIPVVLMWSSFMELDEKLAQQCGADQRLEKPFDVEILRQIVLALVPRTHSQRLAHFLKFPSSVTEPLREEMAQKGAPPVAAPEPIAKKPVLPPIPPPVPAHTPTLEAQPESPSSNWNMESFDEPDEEFAEFKLTSLVGSLAESPETADPDNEDNKSPGDGSPESTPRPPQGEDSDPWSHQDLSRFKIDLPPVSVESDEVGLTFDLDEGEVQGTEFLMRSDNSTPMSPPPVEEYGGIDQFAVEEGDLRLEVEEMEPVLEEVPEDLSAEFLELDGPVPSMSADRLEEIIRAQSREIIEDVVRRVVPDLASEIIRQELKRLLEENPNPSAEPVR